MDATRTRLGLNCREKKEHGRSLNEEGEIINRRRLKLQSLEVGC